MKGSKGKLPKTRLMKKAGSVKSNKDVAFRFAKGSTHTFKIRALDIGNVKSIMLEVYIDFCLPLEVADPHIIFNIILLTKYKFDFILYIL